MGRKSRAKQQLDPWGLYARFLSHPSWYVGPLRRVQLGEHAVECRFVAVPVRGAQSRWLPCGPALALPTCWSARGADACCWGGCRVGPTGPWAFLCKQAGVCPPAQALVAHARPIWVRILASFLCSYPVVAIWNYHKLGAFEQQKFILSCSGSQKYEIWHGVLLSRGSGGELVLVSLSSGWLLAVPGLWLHLSNSCLRGPITFRLCVYLCLSLLKTLVMAVSVHPNNPGQSPHLSP